jgi:hypothetical protein
MFKIIMDFAFMEMAPQLIMNIDNGGFGRTNIICTITFSIQSYGGAFHTSRLDRSTVLISLIFKIAG